MGIERRSTSIRHRGCPNASELKFNANSAMVDARAAGFFVFRGHCSHVDASQWAILILIIVLIIVMIMRMVIIMMMLLIVSSCKVRGVMFHA